ncbi:hypothetical protein A2467_02320 [Candidatus Nomurabacteria bacterium RIFOXYC2_FULL_36_8]|nr:MAG: Hydrolase, NUDIX family [Candidatus Nomurabacteria bacterium GW2011_GWF2_36_126]KKP97125.1 MAG: Hydrolase, NUDIX family [Candidatus Nomurabacteria bacterium GW2011_GWD2_36_14]KKP99265.1 MAG: Hydrolase, NUDIX family [Candidatus Nomurabacteria bacterium GW2011_GWF2_36_19]KKQ05912.1 MAG: Hydrolase, NUDIX family [Candidatus Nomurabacteria bacterium GW2011_GWF1_36_47]KKQ09406.1 MAG: Hydrolase, NUDIX family [Candidatus Nomurabacteria bacterium GW2011_GWB1_36_6]KKQ13410.1 MAG: Hydrolase, NUDI
MEKKKIGTGFGVLILQDNKLLLGLRNSDPQKADSALRGEGTWTMPGGKFEYGETFEQGAIREVKEETNLNLDITDIEIVGVQLDLNEYAHFITIGMLAKKISGDLKIMEPDEIISWDWFELNNIPTNIFPASAKILEKYKKGLFYIK